MTSDPELDPAAATRLSEALEAVPLTAPRAAQARYSRAREGLQPRAGTSWSTVGLSFAAGAAAMLMVVGLMRGFPASPRWVLNTLHAGQQIAPVVSPSPSPGRAEPSPSPSPERTPTTIPPPPPAPTPSRTVPPSTSAPSRPSEEPEETARPTPTPTPRPSSTPSSGDGGSSGGSDGGSSGGGSSGGSDGGSSGGGS